MMSRRVLAGSLCLTLLLAGCARQPLKPIDSWEAHQKRIVAVENWRISGKLGARFPENSGSARLRWLQQGQHYRIDLSGPFGQGQTRITGTPNSASLRQSGEAPIEADSAQELLWQTTGWLIPVEQLLYWVRGIPDPHSQPTHWQKTSAGLLAELTQKGWHLKYEDYTLVNETWHLPTRIVATRDDIRLTLVIYDWSLEGHSQ